MNDPPRIGLLSAWLSRRNGGVFEAVAAQVGIVRAMGAVPVVIGLADGDGSADRDRLDGAEVIARPVKGWRRFGYAPGLVRALLEAKLDLLHLHGLWMYPSHAAARWARATGRPFIISPHGMLDPWIIERGIGQKRVARWLYEQRSWRAATRFHALSEDEARDIRAATGRDAVVVLPNPVTPAPARPATRPSSLLYLGRIHPKKNVQGLLDGWSRAADHLPPGTRLTIAGWGEEGDVAALNAAIARLGRADVRFAGPLFGEAKCRALADARFLVLPSFSEGLPMAVLEAWAAGTPTVMSAACHLPQGFAAGAAIDCGTTSETIAATLTRAFHESEAEWSRRSHAATRLVHERFSPAVVGEGWRRLYGERLADGSVR